MRALCSVEILDKEEYLIKHNVRVRLASANLFSSKTPSRNHWARWIQL